MIDASLFENYRPQRMFLVQGSQADHAALIEDMQGSQDIIQALSVSRFTVEHAAIVSAFATEGDGRERLLIVFFSLFSPDAAQILLKSLEEPDPQTTVIFITPYPYVIPITIRSRVALIQTERTAQSTPMFTRAQALEYVKKEFSSDGEDDASTRRAYAAAFLDRLEVHCKADPRKAKIIYDAKRMLFRANMPTKFVMEYAVSVAL